jgi:hypothetical protein
MLKLALQGQLEDVRYARKLSGDKEAHPYYLVETQGGRLMSFWAEELEKKKLKL